VDVQGGLKRQDRADLCAGFQAAVADVLAEKTRRALSIYLGEAPAAPTFAVAGGVAANGAIRWVLQAAADAAQTAFVAPPLALCTDNAAMIAYAGAELMRAGHRDDMTLAARPRWPLDRSGPALLGSGKKGAKARSRFWAQAHLAPLSRYPCRATVPSRYGHATPRMSTRCVPRGRTLAACRVSICPVISRFRLN